MQSLSHCRLFVEPFAGGGIASLTVAMENLADRVVMIELDDQVAAVWETILEGDYQQLVDRILSFEISRKAVIDELSQPPRDRDHFAFQTILRNRVQRGGILAPGASLVRNGENGRGVASRWYPQTLARRIEAIAQVRHRIEFYHGDAMDLLPQYLHYKSSALFIDPPYTAGGKRAGNRLYARSGLDHERLFDLAARAGGSVMMTYDNASEPRQWALRHRFQVETVPMSNTHHQTMLELVITN